MRAIALPSNQPPDRFYAGGPRIDAFRGMASPGNRVPEDWIASTTTLAGEQTLGLTTLPGGMPLRDAIAADPEAWLGRPHLEAFGLDTKLLVKLLDAGQRLPVHAHPHSDFAAAHLGRRHGKAEAWFILEPGEVHLGLIASVDSSELHELVLGQEAETLLGMLHSIEVGAGDTVYVPPGTLHAIGAGTFIAEVQEPEDLSILLEWRDFELDGLELGHLGLGFPTAIGALDLTACTSEAVAGLVTRGRTGRSVMAAASEEFFRAENHVVDGAVELESGFAVLILVEGTLSLEGDRADEAIVLNRGSTVVIPHALGALRLSGTGSALLFRPPTPHRG